MRISEILAQKGVDVVCVGPLSSVADVVKTLTARRIGAVLVMAGDSILGVVSERDVVAFLIEHRDDILSMKASDIMVSPAVTITPDDSVVGAMRLMTRRRIRHLPVLESGHLVGIVSIGDLVKARIELAEREAMELKEYIAMT